MPITYTDLAYFDDLLVDCLIDRVFYWATIRKVREYKPIRGISEDEILNIIKEEIVKPEKPSISDALDRFINIRAVQIFLSRFQSQMVRNEFEKHTKRYLQIYLKECGFSIEVTDRYTIRSKMLEACVIARRNFDEGEEIRYLSGFLVELNDDEEEELNKSNDKDFSIINSTRLGRNCLMLGPARFVNHNCNPNSRFVSSGMNMSIYALREISIGEEITVEYSENYFGKQNKECLCATCEGLGRNGWAKEGEVENILTLDESSISPSLSPSPLFSRDSRDSTPSSLHTSSEPEPVDDEPKRLLRPRKSISINSSLVKPSIKESFKQYHEYQKKFYVAPFLPENIDNILTCKNCKTPFLKPKEDKLVLRSLIRNYCHRCHRQVNIYNSFWPSVKENSTEIQLYKNPFEDGEGDSGDDGTTDEDNSEVETTEAATSKEYFRGNRRRKFLPAVGDEIRKPSAPRRVSSWVLRRQKEDSIRSKSTSPSKRRKFDKPETTPSRHSARLELKKLEDEFPTTPRKRTPSLKLLESV